MMAMLYIFLGLFLMSFYMVTPSQEAQDDLQDTSKTISAAMSYYNAEAQIYCLPADGSNNCSYDGVIKGLNSREGVSASSPLAYGKFIKSWTDGSTYIATTVCGQSIGRMNLQSMYSWIQNDLYNITNNKQVIGFWNGHSVTINNRGVDNNMSVYKNEYTLSSNPCGTLYLNQPIIYQKILN